MFILLSEKSLDLIAKLCKKQANLSQILVPSKELDAQTLSQWFAVLEPTQEVSDAKTTLYIHSLHASLLKDLHTTLNKKETKEDPSWWAKSKYKLLTLAGTIYFGCQGFGDSAAFMEALSSIPALAVFVTGTLFSLFSVLVFYSCDLREISKDLGIKPKDTPQILDSLWEELKHIKKIRLTLAKTTHKNIQELEDNLDFAKIVQKRHAILEQECKKLQLALDKPYLKIGKLITSLIEGLIFFSGGYFAGQTVALACASLFLASVATTAWPIVLASVVVGFAALSIYWFVERPGIENLISKMKGLDKAKIDALCDPKAVTKETEKLNNLVEELDEKIQLQQQHMESQNKLLELTEQVGRLEQELQKTKVNKASQEPASSELSLSPNKHIFFPDAKTVGLVNPPQISTPVLR